MKNGYRIPKEQLSCKFGGEHWMGSCPMFECTYDGEGETADPCNEDKTCAGYSPVETFICEKHDEEYTDICWSCENENDQRMYEADKEYRDANDG